MGGSSSHRRKRNIRSRKTSSAGTAPIPVPSINRTLNFENLEITDGIGFNLLKKSGWVPGQSIGSPPLLSDQSASPVSARSTPIPIIVNTGRAGIGAPSPMQCTPAVVPQTPSPRPFPAKWGRDHAYSPALVRHLADMDIFDPLRPTCQYDSSHVVRNLKALRKHELSCPANPNRQNPRDQTSVGVSIAGPSSSDYTLQSMSNQFSSLMSGPYSTSPIESADSMSDDSVMSPCSDSGSDSDLSFDDLDPHYDEDELNRSGLGS